MNFHDLKCDRAAFEYKWAGSKAWEFRFNDRNYQVDDCLNEYEYDPISGQRTGRLIAEVVTYILHGPAYGVPAGYCIMSTRELYRSSCIT